MPNKSYPSIQVLNGLIKFVYIHFLDYLIMYILFTGVIMFYNGVTANVHVLKMLVIDFMPLIFLPI